MRVLLVLALLALATLGGCGGDDDEGGSGSPGGTTSAYCTMGAKTLELVAERFRQGRSVRRIVEEFR